MGKSKFLAGAWLQEGRQSLSGARDLRGETSAKVRTKMGVGSGG